MLALCSIGVNLCTSWFS